MNSMFDLSDKYRDEGMSAYVELQQKEFASESRGYTATKHQREVGAGYFDSVAAAVTGGASSLGALTGSTEEEQFDLRAGGIGEYEQHVRCCSGGGRLLRRPPFQAA